jgi:hypothetical protein
MAIVEHHLAAKYKDNNAIQEDENPLFIKLVG